MGNQNKIQNKNAAKTVRKTRVRKFTKPGHLLLRLCVLVLIAVAAVVFTDKKKYFITDQVDPHHEQRWDAVYELTPKHPLDVVVLGNSHVNTGVEPFTLSCTLGCTAFDMAPSGITIADAYYCLKELLTRTTPKLVVVETYLMRGTEGPSVEGSALADEFRSFYPRRNNRIKLESLPVLFDVESYLPAWSFTLRNHELFLRDREGMKKNLERYEKRQSDKDKSLYLGRFARFTEGISDSIMQKYINDGPVVDGREEKISLRDINYARKIVDMCDEKGIEVMFFTLPMYERHIDHYDVWRDEQSRAIIPTGKAWYNLQMPYLASVFDSDCFESTYEKNQHMTIYGSILATYKLAHYITDVLKVDLPDRRNEKGWIDMIYGKDSYFENLSPRSDDPDYRIVVQDTVMGNEHILECLQKSDGRFYIKMDNNTTLPDRIGLVAEAIFEGERGIGGLDVMLSGVHDPVHHKLYMARLNEGVTITRLVDWVIPVVKTPN